MGSRKASMAALSAAKGRNSCETPKGGSKSLPTRLMRRPSHKRRTQHHPAERRAISRALRLIWHQQQIM
eukprot:scaffold170243_cov42-Prasinocladus_malaysianus.AAC.3